MYTGVTESARPRDPGNLNIPITHAEAMENRRRGIQFTEQQANASSVPTYDYRPVAKALDTALEPFPEARSRVAQAFLPFLDDED